MLVPTILGAIRVARTTPFVAAILCAFAGNIFAADTPPTAAFRTLEVLPAGPRITPYLKYQTEMAWREDDSRRKQFDQIRDEQDLLRLQRDLRSKLLTMLGGLPAEKTPLNPRITGRIQMEGYRIEKLIFESLPGVYVTALVYVPEDHNQTHPAILVPVGHSPTGNGKVKYLALCQRLVQRGYVVISWDPIGQGERSQLWDAKTNASRYNRVCAEHAVLGNLAYLAGTNLARWEIWDGIRAVDYLLTRADVDPNRISITGTSGGGFQAAHIAALDDRIKAAAPSCYITALPMRVYNRIFTDPDSDPEQDLSGMISNGVDHPGLLLLMYPRPVFVAAAVLDFFPIEGTRKTFREVAQVYARFGHGDRIQMVEGYHLHQYSPENQEAAMEFLDRFNQVPVRHELAPTKEVDEKALQCTRSGQVMLDFSDARPLTGLIRDYYVAHKSNSSPTLSQLYYGDGYPGIDKWSVSQYDGSSVRDGGIEWELPGSTRSGDIAIDRYLLHHSQGLVMPLLYIHHANQGEKKVLLWLGREGKATAENWSEITKYIGAGYDVVSFDSRGLGETRMPYRVVSEDYPQVAKLDFGHAYVNPISGVLADYVYNSLLTGRPYFLQMIEDAEIAIRFSRATLGAKNISVTGDMDAYFLAQSIAETVPDIKLVPTENAQTFKWSEIIDRQQEIWPIQYLLPGGAYVH